MCAVGDIGALGAACGVNFILHLRAVVAPRVHICLEVLGALVRERQVEQHRLFAHLALEVVPPVVLLGVGEVVCPDIEVCAEETLVGRLSHILLHSVCGDALILWRELVVVDGDALQEVFALGEFACDAARRA